MVETQGPTVDAVSIAFGVLTLVTISLRLWARIFVVKSLGIDDYLICVAALLSWGFIATTLASVRYGLGSHISDVEEHYGADDLITYAQIVWLSSLFYNACLGFIKVSALALYMRLGDRTLRRLAIIMIAVVTCQASANVLAALFQCTPISAAWDKTAGETYKCIDINAFYLANAAVNIFTDLLTYSLPIPLALKLQMPLRQRIGLAVILCLGLFYIPQMLVSTDATWAIAGAMYWSVIETNIGILSASIPSWKVLAKRYVPRLLGSSNGRGGTSGKYNTGSGAYHLSSMGGGGGGGGVGTAKAIRLPSTSATHETEVGVAKKSFGAHVGKRGVVTRDDSSDEEALFTPTGRIGVKTEISMKFEEQK
ncbi:hypothetical protein N0V82_004923 [Gnomoniopsis sp. IMI 355080]|nr:hypothetical protein N0V82_004923 [Gnomoniopsis sp. IMI 355080]